jgi:voltage-gated potassium channel
VANFGAKRSTQRPGILGVLATLRLKRGPARNRILFTKAPISAEATLAVRALLIVLLFSAVIAVFWWDRAGLRDNVDDHVSLSDVIYFTMVTVTTVGYGDIVPVSERARLIDALFVTPVRIFVWFIFLGTAYQFLIQRVIEDLRMLRLQKQLQDHILVLGYGSGGTTAVAELVAQGIAPEDIVVIDHNEQRVRQAAAAGFTGLSGEATREELLRVAGADRARAAIVALDRDDTTVLTVLTLRHLSKKIRIVATVREPENRKLLKGSGADAIVAPYQLGGFLLADAVSTIAVSDLLTDMLSRGGEVALVESVAAADEVGKRARELPEKLVVAIRRDGRRIAFWDDPDLTVKLGDALIAIVHNGAQTTNVG